MPRDFKASIHITCSGYHDALSLPVYWRTPPRKENFFNQINQLIDWESIGQAIAHHYAPTSDAIVAQPTKWLVIAKIVMTKQTRKRLCA